MSKTSLYVPKNSARPSLDTLIQQYITYTVSGDYVTIAEDDEIITGSKIFSAKVNVSDATQSTSSTIGALITAGGLGVAKNTFLGGTLNLPDGTVAAPSFTFSSDADTGIYRIAANTLAISAGGVVNFRCSDTQTQISNRDLVFSGVGWWGNSIGVSYDPSANPVSAKAASILSTAEFSTVTDTTTAAAGTVANRYDHGFLYKNVAATNAGVTYTNSATVYIDRAPNHSGVTATNSWSLRIAAGNIGLGTGRFITSSLGTAAAPAVSIGVNGNDGIYSAAAAQLNLVTGGGSRVAVTNTSTVFGTRTQGIAGSVSGVTFGCNAADTGMYGLSATQLGFAAGGTRGMDLTSTRLSLSGDLYFERSGFNCIFTCPVLSADQTLTIPASGSGQIVVNNFLQGLSNKNLAQASVFFTGLLDNTKRLGFDVDSNTSGITGTLKTQFTTAKIITFPDVSGTVITTANLQSNVLGFASRTTDFTTSSTSYTAITSLSTSITVPSGGRGVKVTVYGSTVFVTALGAAFVSLWNGTVGSGTQLQAYQLNYSDSTAAAYGCCLVYYGVLAAGSYTLAAGIKTSAGNVTMEGSATAPAFILAELI